MFTTEEKNDIARAAKFVESFFVVLTKKTEIYKSKDSAYTRAVVRWALESVGRLAAVAEDIRIRFDEALRTLTTEQADNEAVAILTRSYAAASRLASASAQLKKETGVLVQLFRKADPERPERIADSFDALAIVANDIVECANLSHSATDELIGALRKLGIEL